MRAIFFCIFFIVFATSHAQRKPNIIFILADDLGYGEIEPYGQRLIKTPRLAAMAKEGMKFTQHYAGTAVCAPSRSSLMTGLHTGHCETRGNMQAPTGGQVPMSDDVLTVAEVLRRGGYTTGMIGKWGLGEPGTSGDPNHQGFDFYYGYTDQVLAHNHFPEYLLRNGDKEMLRNKVQYLDPDAWHKGKGSIAIEKKDFTDSIFTAAAINFISEHKDTNFFLYLPYVIPHDNGEAAIGNQYEVPSQREYHAKRWTKDQKDYAASITYLDEYVGMILDHLRKLKLDSSTLVVFTSDNGPKTDALGFNSGGGFKGIKRDLYEGGIRVPFMAWWPGTIKPNTTSHHVSAFWDFLPTAADVANIPVDFRTDGISFLPTLTGKGTQRQHDYLYFEFHEQGGAQAVRQGKWKGIRLNIKTRNPSPTMLYDLEKDPGEKTNLADTKPDQVKTLETIMDEAHVPSPLFSFPVDKP